MAKPNKTHLVMTETQLLLKSSKQGTLPHFHSRFLIFLSTVYTSKDPTYVLNYLFAEFLRALIRFMLITEAILIETLRGKKPQTPNK